MTNTHLTYWRMAFALAVQTAVAQQCYYPNGSKAPEKPCSSADGSACCPDNWQCLDNGLCYYPPINLWGRYSCTDKSWKAEGCPSNMCTYNMQASGGESITQCSDHDNQWCCNADAEHVNCCKESPAPRPFFDLADGTAYATVGSSTASNAPNLAIITGLADSSDAATSVSASATGSKSPQSTKAPSSTPSPSQQAAPTTQLQTSVSSGTAGIVTVVRTSVVTPPASTSTSSTPSDSSSSSKSSKLPVIVGCAAGIPLFLAMLGILFWLLRKRSRLAASEARFSKPPFAEEIMTDGSPAPAYDFAGGATHNRPSTEKPVFTTYKSSGGVPELAGQSIGPERPQSTIDGRAELDSGTGFLPGALPPHAPYLVGLGGGNGNSPTRGHHIPHSSWGSPANHNSEPVPLSVLGAYNKNGASSRPASAVGGTPSGGYIAYKPNSVAHPPQAQELSTVTTPPAAELPSVMTPPVAELSTARTPPA